MAKDKSLPPIDLGDKVSIHRDKLEKNKVAFESKAIMEHHGARIAAMSMAQIEELLLSRDPEERKEARELLKIFAPKMYRSKESEKEVGEEKQNGVDAETAKMLSDIIQNQKELIKVGKSRSVKVDIQDE